MQPVSRLLSIRCGRTIPEIQAGRGFQNQGVGARGLTVSLACTQVKWLTVKGKMRPGAEGAASGKITQ